MKNWILVCCVIMLVCSLSACDEPRVKEKNTPRFESISSIDAFPVKVPAAFRSTRGWLVVAEDRTNLQSSEIKLPVAIVKSRQPSSESPVLYLSGGPGTSAMSAAAYPGAYPWLANRDFVVFGQRGTQLAKPALTCPEYSDAIERGADERSAVIECRSRLMAAGVVIEHYNSKTSAQDIEDIRQVLNIDQWNLYGVSYGTRLALTYARDYSDNIRAMILDSPLPPNAIYDDESAANLEIALRAVAKDCGEQKNCNEAFPDLEKRFFNTIRDANRLGITVPGIEPPIKGFQLASLIDLSSSKSIQTAPLMMDRVSKLEADVINKLAVPSQASNFAWGMRLSVWCSEALPFSRRSQLDKPEDILGGYESAAIDPTLCDAWDVPPLDNETIAPVKSDVPTIIFAGEFDPLTPPSWGIRAAETLQNSLVVNIRGAGHGGTQNWGGDGCAMELAAAFVDKPELTLNGIYSDYCVFRRSAPNYQIIQP